MPKQVIEDAWVTLSGVDLSSRVKKVTIITKRRSPQLVTAMTDTNEDYLPINIRGWRVAIEFYQDFASGSVYETLKATLNSTASSGHAITVRPTTGARTTGNPEWQGQVHLDGDLAQIDGSVGDVLMTNPSFQGSGALTMATTSS
jgi:hypothetical protein